MWNMLDFMLYPERWKQESLKKISQELLSLLLCRPTGVQQSELLSVQNPHSYCKRPGWEDLPHKDFHVYFPVLHLPSSYESEALSSTINFNHYQLL